MRNIILNSFKTIVTKTNDEKQKLNFISIFTFEKYKHSRYMQKKMIYEITILGKLKYQILMMTNRNICKLYYKNFLNLQNITQF